MDVMSWLTLRSLIVLAIGIVLGALIYDLVFNALDDRHSTRWFARRNFWLRLAAYGIAILVIVLATESLLKAFVALVGLGLVWLAFWLKNRNGIGHGARVYTAPEATGTVRVHIDDLPRNKRANVKVTGPENFERTVDRSTTLRNIKPGHYTFNAESIRNGHGTYVPDAEITQVDVAAGRKVTVTIVYAEA